MAIIPVEIDENSQIWDQLEDAGETDTYYKMFLTYAGIPPGQRTVESSWQKWSGKKTQVSTAFYEKYRKFRWRERATAWDIVRMRDVQDDWLMRENMSRDSDYEIGRAFKRIARIALDEYKENYDSLTPNQIARFAELGSSLERGAIPDLKLKRNEIIELVNALPTDKKDAVIKILMAEIRTSG